MRHCVGEDCRQFNVRLVYCLLFIKVFELSSIRPGLWNMHLPPHRLKYEWRTVTTLRLLLRHLGRLHTSDILRHGIEEIGRLLIALVTSLSFAT